MRLGAAPKRGGLSAVASAKSVMSGLGARPLAAARAAMPPPVPPVPTAPRSSAAGRRRQARCVEVARERLAGQRLEERDQIGLLRLGQQQRFDLGRAARRPARGRRSRRRCCSARSRPPAWRSGRRACTARSARRCAGWASATRPSGPRVSGRDRRRRRASRRSGSSLQIDGAQPGLPTFVELQLVRPSYAPHGAQGRSAGVGEQSQSGLPSGQSAVVGTASAGLGNADVVELLVGQLRAGVAVDARRLADEQAGAALGRGGDRRRSSTLRHELVERRIDAVQLVFVGGDRLRPVRRACVFTSGCALSSETVERPAESAFRRACQPRQILVVADSGAGAVERPPIDRVELGQRPGSRGQ